VIVFQAVSSISGIEGTASRLARCCPHHRVAFAVTDPS